jgi:ribonuclease P protein component
LDLFSNFTHVFLYKNLKKTFGKIERLSSPRAIGRVFQRGSVEVKTLYLFPFRLLYLSSTDTTDPEHIPQVLFSIPKRQFKKAVDRNLIRRRCKEAYRLNKQILSALPAESQPTSIAFLYLAKDITTFDVIETAMKRCLRKLGNTPSGMHNVKEIDSVS